MKNSRSCITFLAVALSLFFGKGLLASQPKASQPNIVIFFIDDMGWRDWSGGGSDFFETPNIDRIAAEGMSFTNGYVNAANCAPSRCCILSGQFTPRNHFYNVWSIHRGNPNKDRLSLNDVPDLQVFPEERVSFAEAMKKAGYQTAMYGKWHVSGYDKMGSGNKGGVGPAMQGFDDVYEHPAGALGKLFKDNPDDPKHMFSYTKRAMKFAEKCVAEKKPFLVYLAHHAVHGGNQSRAANLEKFKNKQPGKLHDKVNGGYGGMMADTDDSIGMMMNKLKELKVDEDTVVVFLSDNGGPPRASQAPLRAWKGTYYEGGIRVPFFVRWPGKIKPSKNDTPVMAIDLYPTMLELAGVADIDQHLDGYEIDGESILPVLFGKKEQLEERAMFWHFPAYLSGNKSYTRARSYPDYRQQPVSVIRRGDWKLMMYMEEWSLDGGREKIATNNSIELYNLKDDISESHNVALKEIEARNRLIDELLAWQKEIGAPIPKEPNGKRKSD